MRRVNHEWVMWMYSLVKWIWHLGSLSAANWVSFDFNVSYSSCWGYSLINTFKLKKVNLRTRRTWSCTLRMTIVLLYIRLPWGGNNQPNSLSFRRKKIAICAWAHFVCPYFLPLSAPISLYISPIALPPTWSPPFFSSSLFSATSLFSSQLCWYTYFVVLIDISSLPPTPLVALIFAACMRVYVHVSIYTLSLRALYPSALACNIWMHVTWF